MTHAPGKLGIDKAAADRFIKHAIAQAKNAQLVDGPSDAATVACSSSSHERVPVKVTSKMVARAEYEKELKELGSEEDDDLQVFDEEMVAEDEEAMNIPDDPPEETRSVGLDKGKGRASEEEQPNDERVSSSRRKRPRVDPFSSEPPYILSEHQLSSDDIRRVRKSVDLPVDTPDNIPQQESKGFYASAITICRHLFTRGLCLDIRRSRGGKSCKKGKA